MVKKEIAQSQNSAKTKMKELMITAILLDPIEIKTII